MGTSKGVFVLFLFTNQDNLKWVAKKRVVVCKFRNGFERLFVEKEDYGGQVLKEEHSVLE